MRALENASVNSRLKNYGLKTCFLSDPEYLLLSEEMSGVSEPDGGTDVP